MAEFRRSCNASCRAQYLFIIEYTLIHVQLFTMIADIFLQMKTKDPAKGQPTQTNSHRLRGFEHHTLDQARPLANRKPKTINPLSHTSLNPLNAKPPLSPDRRSLRDDGPGGESRRSLASPTWTSAWV